MIIQGEDFKFIPVKPEFPVFDVELLKTVNKGKQNERTEFQNVAYGVNIDTAIKMVVSYRINKNSPDVLSLKDYLNKYLKGIKELKEFCYEKEDKEDL